MCGMSETEFWHTTPRYFFARQDAEIRRQRTERERDRFLAYYTLVAQHGTDKIKNEQSVCIFDWERDSEGGRLLTLEDQFNEITPEQWAKFNEEADEFLEKVKSKKNAKNGEHSAT